MQRLEALETRMLVSPDQQISLTDVDSRSISNVRPRLTHQSFSGRKFAVCSRVRQSYNGHDLSRPSCRDIGISRPQLANLTPDDVSASEP
jgi:hypothetical protein